MNIFKVYWNYEVTTTMHPPILSKYMLNILYNIMQGQPLKSPTTKLCLPTRESAIPQVYHGNVTKCCSTPSII